MKHLALFFLLINNLYSSSFAQSPAQNAAIEIEAKTIRFPKPSIKLTWRDDLLATKWKVYKKSSDGLFELYQTVQSPDTNFIDFDIKIGKSYTYLIHKENVSNVLGFGVVTAGVKTKAIFDYGTCLVLVEDSVYQELKSVIDRYFSDLSTEGWAVLPKMVSVKEDHFSIKSKIKTCYTESDSTLSTVVLIGNIAVPYSGYIVPDGHNAVVSPARDHQGAWPADVYYADIDGIWTDNELLSVNEPERSENINVKHDGKFDQSFLPSDADLMVGRIYLEKFRFFEKDRFLLYKRYFDRNHDFRIGKLAFEEKAIVNDDFQNMPEGFAGIGYRSFSTMVGRKAIENGRLAEKAIKSSYLSAYGCGAGDYDKSGAVLKNSNGQKIDSFKVSQTADYFRYPVNCAFNILFGSYFGDWDSKNNLLRAPLAGKSPALATFWAGRPVWLLNEFAHGLPIGYSTKTSQNNSNSLFSFMEGDYETYARMVHIALMGDPTIKLRHIKPLEKIDISSNKTRDTVYVNWAVGTEYNGGYYVFRRANHLDSSWHLMVDTAIKESQFVDENPLKGESIYRVWPCQLHKGFSGSYEILGQFAQDSIAQIKETVSANFMEPIWRPKVYPNPAKNEVFITASFQLENTTVELFNLQGKKQAIAYEGNKNQIILNTSHLSNGIYIILINGEMGQWATKLTIN